MGNSESSLARLTTNPHLSLNLSLPSLAFQNAAAGTAPADEVLAAGEGRVEEQERLEGHRAAGRGTCGGGEESQAWGVQENLRQKACGVVIVGQTGV